MSFMKENRKNKERKRQSDVPKWMRLDNAALIYPPMSSKKYTPMYRLTVTLKEEIDSALLEKALQGCIKRFPYYACRIRQGLFWCYFERIDNPPHISLDAKNPLISVKGIENGNYLFRVRYFSKRIALEMFHALADGTGAVSFIVTICAEYLRLKYGADIKPDDMILDINGGVDPEEYEDSLKKYSSKPGKMDKEKSAYHVKGYTEEKNILNIVTGTLKTSDLIEISRKYGCTVTAFLTSVLIYAFQQQKEKDYFSKKIKKPIKIQVPVNMRKYYPSRSMRNFSSYVNIGIDVTLGHYSFEEILSQVKGQMMTMITKKELTAKITGNVLIEKNVFIKCIPMFIKKYILNFAELLMGDRYITGVLTNIGSIKLPPEMAEYVDSMTACLGRARRRAGGTSCISCGDKFTITFSRRIRESETEMYFFRTLVEMGLEVEIDSNC